MVLHSQKELLGIRLVAQAEQVTRSVHWVQRLSHRRQVKVTGSE